MNILSGLFTDSVGIISAVGLVILLVIPLFIYSYITSQMKGGK